MTARPGGQLLRLPMGPDMTEDDSTAVIEAVDDWARS